MTYASGGWASYSASWRQQRVSLVTSTLVAVIVGIYPNQELIPVLEASAIWNEVQADNATSPAACCQFDRSHGQPNASSQLFDQLFRPVLARFATLRGANLLEEPALIAWAKEPVLLLSAQLLMTSSTCHRVTSTMENTTSRYRSPTGCLCGRPSTTVPRGLRQGAHSGRYAAGSNRLPGTIRQADPRTATETITSTELASAELGHRRRFGLWDGSRLPTSTEPVAIGSQRSRVKPPT